MKITIADPPLVPIFELTPPPSVPTDLSTPAIQTFINHQYELFRWPDQKEEEEEHLQPECDQSPGELNKAQKFAYHVANPISGVKNLLLYHSLGSGKTPTAMLLASLYARAGWTIIIATKKELIGTNEYLREAFVNGTDFNIQQYLAAEGNPAVRSIRDLLPAGQNSEADIINRGLEIWKSMGVRFDRQQTYISYEQLGRISADSGRRELLHRLQKRENMLDPFYKCFIIVDEAHKMVTATEAELRTGGRNYGRLLRQLLESRKISGADHGARVLLLTATPVSASPIDAILLGNLLCGLESETFRFGRAGAGGGWSESDAQWGAEYRKMEEWWRRNGQGEGEARVRKLFQGKISYFNYMADQSKFPRPLVQIIPIRVTEGQALGIAVCKHEDLFRCTNMNYLLPKLREGGKGRGRGRGKKNSSGRKYEALSSGWKMFFTHLRALPEQTSKIAYLRRHSEILFVLLRKIWECNNSLPGRKQYVACSMTSRGNDGGDMYGADLIADVLCELYGYVRVNERQIDSSGRIWPEAKYYSRENTTVKSFRSAFPLSDPRYDYKRIMVYSKRALYQKTETSRTEKTRARLISRFNGSDGRDIVMFINSDIGKEGMSVRGVSFAHMVGIFRTGADLQQAAARVIRNCSQSGFGLTFPWKIPFFLYHEFLPSGVSVRDHALAAEQYILAEQAERDKMTQLLREEAIDKLLFQSINTTSERIMNAFI